MELCVLCPRQCRIDRTSHKGYCGAEALPKIGRAALHYYEEPCLSGNNGSGAVFFSGCNLKCIFCQNHVLQSGKVGKTVTIDNLTDVFLNLQQQGAHNINLVTPTPHLDTIIPALRNAKMSGLSIPVVYNTNSYMEIDSVISLDGLVDIWLADLKYKDSRLSKQLSFAEDYFEKSIPAIRQMYRQSGKLKMDPSGIARSGVLIRHLVMPGCVFDTRSVLEFIKNEFGSDAYISLMSQYTPLEGLPAPFNRRITEREYNSAVDYALNLGLSNVFTQELSSATFAYTPDFNLE